MPELTQEQMVSRIAQLEALLAKPARDFSRGERASEKSWKAAQKKRKAQFRLEAQKRARLHCTLNRYHC